MFEGIKIGDRVKLEHVKSRSFVDSVVVDFDEGAEEWVMLPGSVMFWVADGWEVVA